MARADTKLMQEQLELLKAENEQLRRKLMLLAGGSSSGNAANMTLGGLTQFGMTRSMGAHATIAGLSVAYLIVDKNFRVIRMNTRMAEFLGVSKDIARKKPALDDFDELDWAPGVCRTLLQDADNNLSEEVFEAERPDVTGGPSSFFQFKALWNDGQGTVTVEDTTRLRTTRDFFERLVSPRIVERLLDSSEDPFTSTKRAMSVVFADLRSFTTFCETAPAQHVQTVFNEFTDLCMDAIDGNDATLDKFVGDQVMALFGAPLASDGHAYMAVKVAVDIQHSIRRVRKSWIDKGYIPKVVLDAYPDILNVGIGINSGEMLIGMFGTERANQYTALGHNVNLAARLCSFASGGEVLAGLETVKAISNFARTNPNAIAIPIKFRTKAQIEVKGIAQPVTVATLAYE